MSQQELVLAFDKGSKMEEQLRNYFLELGFYVLRGVKFKYDGFDITDLDLWLYNRPSTITRERINVDIKYKKTPLAIERIFWTKGLMEVLNLDNCIVATTEKRVSVREFGLKNKVTVIDGNLLVKIFQKVNENRLTEEEFNNLLTDPKAGKLAEDWRKKYEDSKSRMLSEMDYSGCNKILLDIKYFFEKSVTNPIRRGGAIRAVYAIISHLLITIDFILKDTTFADIVERGQKFEEGIKYGNLGKEGLKRTVNLAVKLTNNNKQIEKTIKELYDNIPVTILKEFFTKSEIAKNLFRNAKEFEHLSYAKTFQKPSEIPNELQSIIAILLDYSSIERKRFFE